MPTIVAMLIWLGSVHGGPAVLPGFSTLAACEAARPEIERAAREAPLRATPYTRCVEVAR